MKSSRYTAQVAKAQGSSERKIQSEIARGIAIPKVAILAGTSLDTPKELDVLAKLRCSAAISASPEKDEGAASMEDHRRRHFGASRSL